MASARSYESVYWPVIKVKLSLVSNLGEILLCDSYENIQLLRNVMHTKCWEKKGNNVKFYQDEQRLAKIRTEALITASQEKCMLVSLSPFQLLEIQSGSLSGRAKEDISLWHDIWVILHCTGFCCNCCSSISSLCSAGMCNGSKIISVLVNLFFINAVYYLYQISLKQKVGAMYGSLSKFEFFFLPQITEREQ